MTDERYSGLEQLGSTSDAPASPDEAVLERVENPATDAPYVLSLIHI